MVSERFDSVFEVGTIESRVESFNHQLTRLVG